jgi:ankyrin repeat protein
MLNTYTLSFDSSVLCTAIQGEASLSIIRRLCAPPIDVNFSSEGGLTALHLAAERGDAAIVELLLKKGASKTALYLGKRPLELSTSLAVGKLLQ